MAVFPIIVGVALSRPPRTHEYRKVVVEARHVWEAKLIAAQVVECSSVMAVSAEWEPSFDMWC